MGYYTRYAMTWNSTYVGGDDRFKPCEHAVTSDMKFCPECGRSTSLAVQILAMMKELDIPLSTARISEKGVTTYKSDDKIKWYEHEVDVATLSCRFPGVVFHLTGGGEEIGDVWDLFAENGKVQKHKARIVRQEVPDPKAWRGPKAT